MMWQDKLQSQLQEQRMHASQSVAARLGYPPRTLGPRALLPQRLELRIVILPEKLEASSGSIRNVWLMLVKGLPRGLPGKGSLTLTRELSNFVFCFVLFFFVFHRVTSESSLSTTGRGGKSAFWQLCLCVEVLRRRSDSPKPVSCGEPQGAACWLAGEWTPTN